MTRKGHPPVKLQPKHLELSGGQKKVPWLNVSGVWLEELGFKAGDTISIATREKLLIIELLEDKENCTKHEAIKKAESLIGVSVQQLTSKPIIQAENLSEIFAKLKQSLYGSSKARAYADSRNIYSAKLEASYNPAGSNSHYRHLKNCMVFPLKDKSGNIVSLYGRNIESKGKDDRHFYLPGRSGLYPCYPDAETETIIITESIIDAATIQLYTLTKHCPCSSTLYTAYGRATLIYIAKNNYNALSKQQVKN